MSIYRKNNKLIYHFDDETVQIESWGQNSLRICCSKENFLSENWALIPQTDLPVTININKNNGEIINGKIKAVIECNGHITFYNSKNELLLNEFNSPGYINISARNLKPSLGGKWCADMRFDSNPDEMIFGMGQYQQEFLNLKGCDLELAQRNSQESIPFYISSLGYGFMWNNPAIGNVVFGKNRTTWHADSTSFIDFWINAGDTPKEIEHNYANVTGKVPMMPQFAMGYWQSKCRYRSQKELISTVKEFKKRNIPIDIIVIDFFHWVMQGDWCFDKKYWPDPEGMCKELRELGIEPMISFWQTVDKRCHRYKEMEDKGYLMHMDRGERVSISYMSDSVYYDAFNEEARKYVWKQLKQNYYDKGIHLFWLDQAECDCPKYEFDNYRFKAGPALQNMNFYPYVHIKGIYDGLISAGEKNPVILIRSAWCGAQRFGALLWSGDIISTFKSLRIQLCAGLNTAISGIPWWTTDIGGFYNGYTDDKDFHELISRWVAFGCFCPVMRLHGCRQPEEPTMYGDKNVYGTGAPNEPWSFGDKVLHIFIKYINLRKKLKPYITKLMKEAHENGDPVIRPMFYEFPEQKNLYDIKDQYMFGDEILVAPVMEKNMKSRNVILPIGTDWIYAWNNKIIHGGQSVTVNTPIDIIPVFIKNGSNTINYFKE